jgi:hypothetical protein
MEQAFLSEIDRLAQTAAATPGGLAAMKAAMARLQEFQGGKDGQDTGAGVPGEEPKVVPDAGEVTHGDGVADTPTPDGQRLGKIHEADTGEGLEPSSEDSEAEFGPDPASAPVDAVELAEAATDPSQVEDSPAMPWKSIGVATRETEKPRILLGEVNGDADARDFVVRWKQEHPVGDVSPAGEEATRPGLSDVCEAAGDVLERALSEIRVMMDQLRFAREMDSEQAEQITREIAATREGVLALAGMVKELREDAASNRETLGVLALAAPTQTALNELQGLVLEQNSSTERILGLLREGQNIIHEDLSKSNADLGNFLGAELAQLRQPLVATQEAMGQVVNSVSGIEGMKPKLLQTWGVSLFWLATVVIYILIRGALSFWG